MNAFRFGYFLSLFFFACATTEVGSIGAVLARNHQTHAVVIREVAKSEHMTDLQPGDEIIMIEGRYVPTMTHQELQQMLRGPVDTIVHMTIVRKDQVFEFSVRRIQLLTRSQETSSLHQHE